MKGTGMKLSIGSAVFRNRVFLASGPAGYGTEYSDFIRLDRLGGVVTKTITLRPRAGNPGRRLWETNAGLLNSIGLENVGAEAFFAEKLPALVAAGGKPIVSLGAEGWDDYCGLLDTASACAAADVFEINLSCPNVERGGMAVGSDRELLGKYVRRAVETLEGKTIIAKLTPNASDVAALAVAAADAGAHALTAINTVVGAELCPGLRAPVFRRVRAGLSGPAILPVALDAVWKITRAVDIPVIGAGGISSVEDAEKFFAAGASAVQVGTAIFYDPGLPERIAAALAKKGIPGAIGAKSSSREG
ncbi:MAG: dihydroorotate dehydrogenase [Candidatus Krumholzibacteria bacterium]|nr:dihydroorotate dehydrogenase [Candidatus Krumholzibacteria bacterium]